MNCLISLKLNGIYRICFYYYIEEDLKLVYEYNHNIKNCSVLKYSEMGNMVAASTLC